jgi:hypothetical protein
MEITKRVSGVGAFEEVFNQLEARVGSVLPDDYRRFMSEFNGGRPEPSGFVFPTEDGKSDSAVRYFLTLDDREERYTIQEFLDRYGDRIPQKLLPIACDSFGNLVLLDAGAKSAGAVCVWDLEKESMDEPTWDNIADVASSFTEFLDALV